MRIETVNINDIHPYEHNAKKHPRRQIEQIKDSISEYGNNDPIAIDQDGMIIEGHGRFEALKELGYTEVEVIRLSNLTEEQKRAYIIAHNKITMETGLDLKKLRAEIEKLEGIDIQKFDIKLEIEEAPEPAPKDPDGLYSFILRLSEEQYYTAQRVIEYIENTVPPEDMHTFGNVNKRSNKIFEAIYQWAEQKTSL
jgi:hypothetical protein